jgi:sugar phosphate isomerase/epimerase
VGLDNLFVNLDAANLIMYGNGSPVDAMDVLGHLVRGVHAKDGLLPADPKHLGKEVDLGKGRVDFPAVFKQLRQIGYTGPINIERESQGAQKRIDILQAKLFLERLIQKTFSK